MTENAFFGFNFSPGIIPGTTVITPEKNIKKKHFKNLENIQHL